PARWLNPVDRDNIVEGEGHLQAAAKLGLFVNSETLPKLAWFEYLLGNTEQSVHLLGQAAIYQKAEGKALSLYYRGAILNRLGRYDQAQASLSQALAERDDLILARQEKGESLKRALVEGGTAAAATPQRVRKVTAAPPKDLRLRRPICCHRLCEQDDPPFDALAFDRTLGE